MPLLDQTTQPFSHHHHLMHPMASQQSSSNSMTDSLTTSSALHLNGSIGSSATTSTLSLSSCSRSSSSCVDTDLETLDRELNALDASMPLVDPEITQGAEQLEKAISRKRSRSEEDNDRLVREALSQFYLPSPRLLSGIDDCPFISPEAKRKCNTPSPVSVASSTTSLLTTNDHLLDFEFDHNHNQSQKEFEVIMDALRLGGTSPSNGNGACNDSCGQAAMMSENGVFHNLVVASLET